MSALIPPTTLDRILGYLRMLVRAEIPRLNFLGLYEYAVQSPGPTTLQDGTVSTYEVAPTDPTISLPGSKGIPLRLSCSTATLQQGSLVVLAFLNGDPSKPVLIGGAPTPTSQVIDASLLLKIGPSAAAVAIAGGVLPAARLGDAVTAGPFGGAITGPCSLKTFIG